MDWFWSKGETEMTLFWSTAVQERKMNRHTPSSDSKQDWPLILRLDLYCGYREIVISRVYLYMEYKSNIII